MIGFYSLPIRKKISLLVSIVVTIALMLMVILVSVVQTERKWTALQHRIEIQADIIGAQAEPAVKFDDKKGAQEEVLAALRADTIILSAMIITEDQKFFASYTNPISYKHWEFLPDFIKTEETISRAFVHKGNAIKFAKTKGQVSITVSLYPVYVEIVRDLSINLSIALAFLLMAMMISRRAIEQITLPILELAATTKKIADAQDYKIRAKVMGSDEIADLTCSFNEMLSQIQARDDGLESTVQSRTAQLLSAKQKAEQASKAKDDFLANMSHELRTPMNAIIGLNHLLKRTTLSPQQVDYVTKNTAAAELLLEVINDVLDLSKIAAGQMKLDYVDFSLSQLLDSLIAIFSIKAYEKKLEFIIYRDLEIADNLVGDSFCLKKVLNNFVANAIKFTHQGEVFVSVEMQAQSEQDVTLLFSVTDTGIGIPSTYIPEIFSPFSQADVSTTRKFGGTGLGLSISQKIVQDMGGEIQINSEEGKGSCFFFSLTLKKSENFATNEFPVEKNILATTSVLLVEDNETSKKVLEKILKPCSKSVHSVANLEAAIIALQQGIERQNPYSLLIVDSKATEKRNKAKNRQIFATVNTMYQLPIILLTAFSTHEKLTTDYIGVEKLVSKPVTAEALFKGICEVFQKSDSTKNCLTTISNKKEILKISDKQILLAEDNPINQQVARELLQIEGFSVTVVDDGQQVLNILKTQSFDLILMDVQMPHLDGYEATKIIRQTYKTKPLPIIAMTAHALQLDREKCLAAGMDDYISKPINPELLSQLLVKYLGQEAELAPILSMPDAGSLYPQIAGIDFLDGLKRVRNNQNLYFKLLNMFITKHGNAVNDIKLAIASNTHKDAISIAHTIKGAATNLGLREISILAGAIEFSLLNNESVTDTQINLFSDALHEFINAVQLIPKE